MWNKDITLKIIVFGFLFSIVLDAKSQESTRKLYDALSKNTTLNTKQYKVLSVIDLQSMQVLEKNYSKEKLLLV